MEREPERVAAQVKRLDGRGLVGGAPRLPPPAANATPEPASGRQKAAVLLVALGERAGGQDLPHLARAEVEALSLEIAKARKVADRSGRDVDQRGGRDRAGRGLHRRGRRRLRPLRARGARWARSARPRSSAASPPRSSAARSSSCAARPRSRSICSCATSRRRPWPSSSRTCTRTSPPRCSASSPADEAARGRRGASRVKNETRPEVINQRVEAVMRQKLSNVIFAGLRRRGRGQVAGRHPQQLRPDDRAQRARRARQGRRRARRGDPPAAVHLRGRRQARRPLDPDGAQGGRPEGPRDRTARCVRGRPRQDLREHVRARCRAVEEKRSTSSRRSASASWKRRRAASSASCAASRRPAPS